jgi:rRNA processing protein Krr1/Pno1
MKHETKDDLQLVRGITVIVTVALSFTKHESMKLLHLTAQLYVVLVGNPTAADNLSL